MDTALDDGNDLALLVRQTRGRLRSNSVRTGVGMLLVGTLGCLAVAAAIDMVWPLAVPLRLVSAGAFWLIAVAALLLGVLWPLLRPLHSDGVAYRMERTVPRMHNRLITVLDLRRNGRNVDLGDPFVKRLMSQTRDRLGGYRIDHVARPGPLRATRWATVGTLLAIGALLALFSDRMPTAVARILRPTAPIAPVSRVKLKPDGDIKVMLGDEATIGAAVERGTVDGLTCALRAAGKRWHHYAMQPDGAGRFRYRLAEVREPFEYQIRGGGTWTGIHRIDVIRRPVIQQLDMAVRLPDYMADAEPRPVTARASQVSAPVGAALQLIADVDDAVAGEIELYERETDEREHRIDDELVWFDDDLPADAVPTGKWDWSTKRAFSGTRAHRSDWSGRAHAFTTRLNPFAVAPGASFFVYAWLDPADPPERITIVLTEGDKEHTLQWQGAEAADGEQGPPDEQGAAEGAAPPDAPQTTLPEPGRWVRLQVPLSRIGPAERSEPARFAGMSFAATSGRAWFDRAGSLTSSTAVDRTTSLRKTASIAMTRDAEEGRWTGSIAIEADLRFALSFRNATGHVSAPMKPVPVVAVADRAPSIQLERPGRDLTLREAAAVPLMARAFDDYGIRRVEMQTGPDAEHLETGRTLAEFDQPHGTRVVLGAIEAHAQPSEPGTALYYRLVAHDFKGQIGASRVARIVLADPQAQAEASLPSAASLLDPLLDGIAELVSLQSNLATEAGRFLTDVLPDPAPLGEVAGAIRLLNPDGTPMTPEQVRDWLAAARPQLNEQQQEEIAQLNEQLAQQQAQLRALQQQFDQAADDAGRSPFALPQEMIALQQMADSTGRFANEGDWQDDGATLQRLAQMQAMLPEMSNALQQLQAQVRQMDAARQHLTVDPVAAQERLSALTALLQGQTATHLADDLEDTIARQQETIAALQQQMARMAEQTADAPAEELMTLSERQREKDLEAMKRLEEARALLDDPFNPLADQTDMVAPWMAPRRRQQAPVERDTPEEDEGEPEEPRAQDDRRDGADDAQDADADWWDRRADLNDLMQSFIEEDERFADRHRPVERRGQDPDQDDGMSPRELFQQHQQAMQQQLTENSNALNRAAGQVGAMTEQMRSLMGTLRDSRAAGVSPAQMAAARQMHQMMISQQMQQMLNMARRARAQAQGRPGEGADGMPRPDRSSMPGFAVLSPTGAAHGRYVIDMGMVDFDLNADERAAVYRLPPRMREPLIRAMNEQPPEGYRHLIDAYYRRLGEEAP